MSSSQVIDVASMSTQDLVDAAASIAAELAHRPAPDSPAACFEHAESLSATCDLHESALAGFIGRVDATGEATQWGLPSTRAWLRTRLGMRDARAKERLALAREQHRLPKASKLLATGELSYGYAATIAGAIARLSDQDSIAAEEILLDLADKGFSPGKLAAFATRITDLIAERDSTDRPPPDTRHGYERSWADSTRSLDGGRYIKAWLNAEDAAVWDTTLGPLAKPAGPDDHRDLAERTAAALTTVLAGGHQAARITLVIDLDALTGGTAPARLPDGTPLPAEQARRLALTAGVSPLILGSAGLPLYLGRRERFATPAQRRVLETLYPTCAVRGCEIPGTLCEVDHVTGWALNNAPTDIDQLTLCCGWHNRFKHANPHQIHITHQNGRYTYRLRPPHHQAPPHKPPPHKQPAHKQPAHKQPAHQPQGRRSPGHETPGERSPDHNPPGRKPQSDRTSSHNPPRHNPSTHNSSVDKSPCTRPRPRQPTQANAP